MHIAHRDEHGAETIVVSLPTIAEREIGGTIVVSLPTIAEREIGGIAKRGSHG